MFDPCVTIKAYFPATETGDTLQIKGSHSSGQGQAAHRACPLQPQRGNGQVSDHLRRSAHVQVGCQAPRVLCSAWMWKVHSFTSRSTPSIASSSRATWRCRSLSRTSSSSCSQEVTLSVQDQTSRLRCPRLKRLCTCATIITKSSSSAMRRCR